VNTAAPASTEAEFFDGVSARARRVTLRIVGDQLRIDGEAWHEQVALDEVQWPERTRHGARITRLSGGRSLQALDAAAWDAWWLAGGMAESAVVKAQQSWRGTAVAVVLLLVLLGASYQWGVPWLSRGALLLVPESADRAIGEAALDSAVGSLLQPSKLPAARQEQLRAAFASAVQRTHPNDPPAYELRFHATPRGSLLGPNAFALPGGTIVVTDALVELFKDRDDVLLGVLGHELGHVRLRHGMRLLVQVTLVGSVTTLVLGDFSTLLAAAPALLGQMAYSRDLEREADQEAIALLRASGISPAVMVALFERLGGAKTGAGQAAGDKEERSGLGIAFSSHPADEERMQVFREAAAR
jgi:Zn-dependent protease with chaperone function